MEGVIEFQAMRLQLLGVTLKNIKLMFNAAVTDEAKRDYFQQYRVARDNLISMKNKFRPEACDRADVDTYLQDPPSTPPAEIITSVNNEAPSYSVSSVSQLEMEESATPKKESRKKTFKDRESLVGKLGSHPNAGLFVLLYILFLTYLPCLQN